MRLQVTGIVSDGRIAEFIQLVGDPKQISTLLDEWALSHRVEDPMKMQ